MSSVLSLLGAASAVIGVVLVAFGVPVREASFGNTLILGGIVSIVGGLILFGLGAAAAQLNRISEALALRPAGRPSRSAEAFEAPLAALPPRVPQQAVQAQQQQPETSARFPFPPKQRPEPGREQPLYGQRAPQGEGGYYDERPGQFAPMMRNPDDQQFYEQEDVSLSPPQAPYPSRAPAEFSEARPFAVPHGANGSGRAERHYEPAAEAGWRQQPQQPAPARQQAPQQPQPAYFDTMWPAAPKSAEQPKARAEAPSRPERAERPEPAFRPEPPMRGEQAQRPDLATRAEALREHAQAASQPRRGEPKASEPPKPPAENRAVAILKSGVVDGMGYTLYVDGSIEATLPQGTLRFASINELRNHLEKNS